MTVMYFLIAVPFKVLSVIQGFTDIRPVTLLGPIYAVFFGVPGCTVMALGNLVMDIVSNSLRWSSIGGLIANFLGPYIIYLYWTRRGKSAFSLRRGGLLLRCVGIIIVSAIVEAITRRRIDPKYEGYIHTAGMVLLLGLMAFVMYQDIARLIMN